MGGIISRNQQDVKLYLQKDYYLHDYPFIRNKSNNKIFAVKQIITDSKQQAQRIKKDAITYKKLSNERINKIIEYIPVQSNKICSEQQFHYIIEGGYPRTSLKDQFLTRKYLKEKFTDNQILSIIKTFCCGLEIFYKHFNRKFSILSLDTVSIDQEKNFQLRLNDPLLSSQTGNFHKILSQKILVNNQEQSVFYEAPQRKKARKSIQFNENQIQVNQFYCNLYTVGILALQIMEMEQFKNKNNKNSLQNQINSVQNSNIRKNIQILTSQNPQKRKQIYNILGIKTSQKNHLQKFYSKGNSNTSKISRPQTPTFNFKDVGNLSIEPIKYQVQPPQSEVTLIPNLSANNTKNPAQMNNFSKKPNIPFIEPIINIQMTKELNSNSSKQRTHSDMSINYNRTNLQMNNKIHGQSIKPVIKFNQNNIKNVVTPPNFPLFIKQENKNNLQNLNLNRQNINFQTNIKNQILIPKQVTAINNNNKSLPPLNKNNFEQIKKSTFYHQLEKKSQSNSLNQFSPINTSYLIEDRSFEKRSLIINQNSQSSIKSEQQIPTYRPNKQVQQILRRLGIGQLLYQNQNKSQSNLLKHENGSYTNFNKNLQSIQIKNSKENLTQISIQKRGSQQIFSHQSYQNMNNKKTIKIEFKNNQTNYNNASKRNQQKLSSEIQQQGQNRTTTPIRPTIKKFKYNSTIVQVGDQDSQNSSERSQLDYNKQFEQINRQYVVQEYQTGSKYQGYKLGGKRDGFGKFYYQDGGYYQGQWKNNKMDGEGRLYYQGGKMAYEGTWKEDQFHGFGKVYNDNPIKLQAGFDLTNFDYLQDYWQYYQGKLVKDTKQGRGKIVLTNGEVFQGDFHNDRIQGYGKFFILQGSIIQGIWKDSKLIKIISS